MLLLPGLGTVARTAMHCAAADVSIQHFGAARDFRMETVGFLLPSHMNPARRAGSSWSTSGLPMRLRDGFRGRAIALGRAPGAGPSRRPIAKWGVFRTSANNWARGCKTYRRGEAVGFVPALHSFGCAPNQRSISIRTGADRHSRSAPQWR